MKNINEMLYDVVLEIDWQFFDRRNTPIGLNTWGFNKPFSVLACLHQYSLHTHLHSSFDFDYTLAAEMKVNELISTQLEVQFVYDDNAVQALQAREIFGIGVRMLL